ncbi:hypothetical protein [Gordonia sp. MP11Mi]|uniref:hypothetical protein n=1 Tax=Gordonia sp. MP11Mi TaxID=3022769 RepID=UPI003B220FC5
MRKILSLSAALAISATLICGCSDTEEAPPDTSPSSTQESFKASSLEGKTVGELERNLWSDGRSARVTSFSTNSVTDIILGKSREIGTEAVDKSFIVAAVLFCEPDQAFVYAVDATKTNNKITSPGFESWKDKQIKSPICNGETPSTNVSVE